ncbi:hypothetical protein LTR62_005801 [Meristemomyces frigidus]|uniref:Uncharacterized protein n=1 Tax=Meristemomyces frigidus TaxID=1508187 RepID=A0AAN7TP11_9PEZI|nr:hypothetical protein LTR62_005801 [Meristemomyces frigidus]
MPRFSLSRDKNKSRHHINFFPDSQHPDRRSVAGISGGEQHLGINHETSEDLDQPSPLLSPGLGRSQTVLRREGARSGRNTDPVYEPGTPSPLWSPGFSQVPTPSEHHEYYDDEGSMSNGHNISAGKLSSDSGQGNNALDRWSQRRLQRLNTEQGFREQRQGGVQVLSPPAGGDHQSGYSGGASYPATQPQPAVNQQSQPHIAQQAPYQSTRTAQPEHINAGLAIQTHPNYQQQQYSPPDVVSHSQLPDASRPSLAQNRSYTQQSDDPSMSSNNAGLPASRPIKTTNNRQSVHNGLSTRETSQQGYVAPPTSGQAFKSNPQAQQQGDVGRGTPQPGQLTEDMTEEDVAQLIKDHKELREKYTKVKKYYFEKEDQVKQLQNSLAHQRLSQSRTSLDDSEYTTRFNRLDGLIAQLAFSIRKSWRSLPEWLHKSVNKDAVLTGKQEMTAAGRAVISRWLVEDCFDRYFHPNLEISLSAQLKAVQLNIRRFSPPAQSVEEDEFLTSKVINWRLATLEGLQDALRSPQCASHRAKFTDMLKEQLIGALAVHLQDPPPSDLEGGVHMIVELVVSIAIHLPVESRDVVIEYFKPGYSIMPEQMKLETGIPALATSFYDENVDRQSVRSASSEHTDMTENSSIIGDQPRKRSMLSALTGTGKTKNAAAQGKHGAATGSSSSLNPPESSHGIKEDLPPRVRMAAGIGASIRGRSVLTKAPVFST